MLEPEIQQEARPEEEEHNTKEPYMKVCRALGKKVKQHTTNYVKSIKQEIRAATFLLLLIQHIL